ncbi:hypothetical protein [Nocardioides sp. SYSU DS0663]|uniref:hypothetical protein n=1 Tax=Nocardioides sp. SYSU DS0663 TaxID=3416445 RepID=UPI003F4BB75E
MILRLWSGWTTPENADRYEKLLNETIAPGIVGRELDGLLAFDVWRRHPARPEEPGQEVEFLTSMVFRDEQAVARFTGGDPSSSVVPASARQVLLRFDEHSRHYQHLREHQGRQRTSEKPTASPRTGDSTTIPTGVRWLVPGLCFAVAAVFIASGSLTVGAVLLGLGAVALALLMP